MTENLHSTEAHESEERGSVLLPDVLSILPIRDTVLFPNAVLPLAVAREASVRLVDEAMSGSRIVGLVTQKDARVEDPSPSDLYQYGTATLIHRMLKYPDGSLRAVVQGLARIRIVEIIQEKPFMK